MNRLEQALIRLDTDLRSLGFAWALIGGLAVSVRAQPRTTWDLDAAIAVASDGEAEGLVMSLRARGYLDQPEGALLEQKDVGRLAGMRLLAPGQLEQNLGIDLLFASSGVETEIAAEADWLEIFPGVAVPVAHLGHLIALKILAGRPRDLEDLRALLREATTADVQEARATLDLIERRGFHRGKDLQADFIALGRLG
jgi:hypothetical protein